MVVLLYYFFGGVLNITFLFLFCVLAELSQENLAVSPQPLRQTPPVQQAQIPQNVYNGQSQGALNQHNAYSGGQIPQGLYINYIKLVKIYYEITNT